MQKNEFLMCKKFKIAHFVQYLKGFMMKKYTELSLAERKKLLDELKELYSEYKQAGLSLDLSRGKPNAEQLDISNGILKVNLENDYKTSDGFDCRNYGIVDGIPEMKRFFADVYGIASDDIIVGGNSSLQLMYDTLSRAMIFGVYGSEKPWCREEGLKWICVVPGYDRHFRITETLGFELLNVKMLADGPDMDEVERLVKDPKVKGIWCIPKYSNPSGNTYSDEVVRRLASMECAAPDFRIMWDNAYAVHDFDENGDSLLNIFEEAEKYGNKDRIFYYSSTSKVTYPGSGVAFMAASENNRKDIIKNIGVQTIGYDKMNQLRHLRFFETAANLKAHMLNLGKVVKGKFDIALAALDSIKDCGIASWTVPHGGYFISIDCMPGTAKRIFELMKEAGVTLTPVGATFPYGVDPEDSNIRLAPTYPADEELDLACKVLSVAVRIATLEKLCLESA